jgi:ATP-dependent Clp protease ATP-binding subunit ClpB
VDPTLAYRRHPYGWTALHMAVTNQKPAIVDLILSRSTAAINERDSWDGSDDKRASFASDRFPHKAMRNSTALHYACLLGDMEIVEVLLRQGADWTIKDKNNLLPERCIDVSNGDDKKHEFKRLCEEWLKRREEEDELKRAKELEENDQLKRTEKLEEDDQSKQSKQSKEAEEEELKRVKKLAEDEELLQRRKRQSECFSSLLLSQLLH